VPITYTPGAQSFGTHNVGSATTATLTVANPGASSVTLEIAGADARAFSIVRGTTVPANAAGHAVTIRFVPDGERSFSAQLRQTNASTTDPKVDLVGVGTLADPVSIDREDADANGTVSGEEVSRFRIHVPYSSTSLVMGRGATDAKTYDGFGVRTGERFFVHAEKNLVVQSMGSAVYKAIGVEGTDDDKLRGNLYAVAGNDATLAGVNSANVIGADGVLIAGGLGGLETEPELGDRDDPYEVVDNDGAERVRENRTNVAKGLVMFDALVSIAGAGVATTITYRSVKDASAETRRKKRLSAVTVAGAAVTGAVGAALSSAGVGGAKNIGGTTIFGASAVTVGSFGFNCAYSAAGLTQAAPFVTTIGLVDVASVGLHSAALQAVWGSATVFGNQKVGIHSNKAVRLTAGAGPAGEVSIDAGKIAIGDKEDLCTKVSLTAKSGAMVGSNVELDGPTGAVKMKAISKVEAKAGSNAALELDIMGVELKYGPASLKLAASGANLVADQCKVGDGKATFVQCAPAGVTIKGAKVNIL
jgi:hypothetical protein